MKRSILERRRRKRITKDFELQLTSMLDMLIILLVFLLKSYASNSTAFIASSRIELPSSSVQEAPPESISLTVDPDSIILDGEKVVEFKIPQGFTPETLKDLKSDQATYEMEPRLLSDAGRRILPLYDALLKAREKAELMMSKAVWKDAQGNELKEPPKFQGVLIIQADKAVRYDLLRKIMYTAGAAQYKIFKLVSVSKEST